MEFGRSGDGRHSAWIDRFAWARAAFPRIARSSAESSFRRLRKAPSSVVAAGSGTLRSSRRRGCPGGMNDESSPALNASHHSNRVKFRKSLSASAERNIAADDGAVPRARPDIEFPSHHGEADGHGDQAAASVGGDGFEYGGVIRDGKRE